MILTRLEALRFQAICDPVRLVWRGVLTYMSMRALIDSNLGSRVFLWEPVRPGAHTRVIHVAKQLYNEITIEPLLDHRIGQLSADLDYFSLGRLLTVGYGREAKCRMKPLDPTSDEVWEMRSLDPEPQVRIFGRFWDRDCFFATHATYRGHLGDPKKTKFEGNHWPAEIRRCKQIWDQIFLGETPHSGSHINEYVTENVVEIGKLR